MTSHTHTETHDVAVVGGGAAGLSAALVLGRARRRVVVVDAGEPRNAPATHMQGFLSRDGMPPGDLLAAGRDEISRYGVELVADRVVAIAPGFTLRLASGRTLAARRLLVAAGATDMLPDVPGARELWGGGLLHCPYCHGWEVRDRPLGVIATGPGSVDYAQLVRQWSDDVAYFAHTSPPDEPERMALEARGIAVVEGVVTRLEGAGNRLAAVHLADGRAVARDALFFRPALRAHDGGLLEGLGCELDAAGLARVDGDGRTSVPGVWAAGNASNPRAQVITAAGEGSAAAISINADLVAEDVATALTRNHGKEQA